jgi:hypothetical protein
MTIHQRWPMPAAGGIIVLAVRQAGVMAQKICCREGSASVVAVFARSFYLRCGDTFLCVGDRTIGNGPLTLVTDFGALRMSDLPLRPGQPACLEARVITCGGAVRLTFEDREPWRPPPWPVALPPTQLIAACDHLVSRAAMAAPPDGLWSVLHTPSDTSLSRIAGPRVARVLSWLADALAGGRFSAAAASDAVAGLIGLGPGLTPSGDDFLVGMLATLDALGEHEAHAALARAVLTLAPARTSPLSACLLGAVACGHVGEHAHAAVSAAMSGRPTDAIAAIRAIGHTSGWDMLAGVAATLRIVASRTDFNNTE